jgi:hypothetical protein
MRLFSVFATGICLFILMACTKDVGVNPNLVPVGFCDTISFSKHIKPIIIARCVSCHQPGAVAGSFADYHTDTYAGIKPKVDNGTFRGRVIDLTMAPTMPYGMSPLPADTIAILKCWLEKGAPNN